MITFGGTSPSFKGEPAMKVVNEFIAFSRGSGSYAWLTRALRGNLLGAALTTTLGPPERPHVAQACRIAAFFYKNVAAGLGSL